MAWMPALIVALTITSAARAQTPSGPQLAASPYDVINAVNALRASYGLAPYSISPTLMAVAQGHADYMAATGKVSHTGLGGSSATDRLLAAGYPLAGDLSLGGFRSENITSGTEGTSAQAAVNQWAGDPPHLNTMISPNLTEIGAGVTVNGGRVYFVIDCAQPTNSGVPQMAGTTVAGGSAVAPVGGMILPVVVVTPNTEGDVIHEVKAGQTLWQIAISYETKIDEIKRLNNLFDNNIYPGTRLLVKKGVAAAPTLPVETVTVEATAYVTSIPTLVVTGLTPTATSTLVVGVSSPSRNNIMGIALGIIALALIGVAWLHGWVIQRIRVISDKHHDKIITIISYVHKAF